jgi:hypothetical protein
LAANLAYFPAATDSELLMSAAIKVKNLGFPREMTQAA